LVHRVLHVHNMVGYTVCINDYLR